MYDLFSGEKPTSPIPSSAESTGTGILLIHDIRDKCGNTEYEDDLPVDGTPSTSFWLPADSSREPFDVTELSRSRVWAKLVRKSLAETTAPSLFTAMSGVGTGTEWGRPLGVAFGLLSDGRPFLGNEVICGTGASLPTLLGSSRVR